jgi:hypothetical protein
MRAMLLSRVASIRVTAQFPPTDDRVMAIQVLHGDAQTMAWQLVLRRELGSVSLCVRVRTSAVTVPDLMCRPSV